MAETRYSLFQLPGELPHPPPVDLWVECAQAVAEICRVHGLTAVLSEDGWVTAVGEEFVDG